MASINIPKKEESVRLTVDLPKSMHRHLCVLATMKGRTKAEIIRVLLEELLESNPISNPKSEH